MTRARTHAHTRTHNHTHTHSLACPRHRHRHTSTHTHTHVRPLSWVRAAQRAECAACIAGCWKDASKKNKKPEAPEKSTAKKNTKVAPRPFPRLRICTPPAHLNATDACAHMRLRVGTHARLGRVQPVDIAPVCSFRGPCSSVTGPARVAFAFRFACSKCSSGRDKHRN